MITFFIQSEPRCGQINYYLFFIQSADSRVNYQPIRYLFNVISLETNLPIYITLKGVHLIIWKAEKAVGQLRRYNILVIYLQSEELAETCLPSFLVYFITVTVHSD